MPMGFVKRICPRPQCRMEVAARSGPCCRLESLIEIGFVLTDFDHMPISERELCDVDGKSLAVSTELGAWNMIA